jgi:uncharacterized protein
MSAVSRRLGVAGGTVCALGAALLQAAAAQTAAPQPIAYSPALAVDALTRVPHYAARPALGGPAIAIVMDDMGDRKQTGYRALQLPANLAFAFLPGAPYAREQAEIAHALGREVLLHLPLEAASGGIQRYAFGVGVDTTPEDVAARVQTALTLIPHVRGVNNHQGSLATARRALMDGIMAELRFYGGLYFVDSVTSGRSVAVDAARARGLPAARREVFLDAEPGEAFARAAWFQLIARARREGAALAIGHPHDATLRVLEQELPRLAHYGVRMVAPSELIHLQGGDRPLGRQLQLLELLRPLPAALPTAAAQ